MKVSGLDIIRCILTILAPVTLLQLLIGVFAVVDFLLTDYSQKQHGARELGIYYFIFSLILNAPLITVWAIHFAKSKKGSSDH